MPSDQDLNAIELGDMDGDGDGDIVASFQDGTFSRIDVLANDGPGGFSLLASALVQTPPTSHRLSDLDGDNDLDVVVATD